jgi:uncharacterized membrane protein
MPIKLVDVRARQQGVYTHFLTVLLLPMLFAASLACYFKASVLLMVQTTFLQKFFRILLGLSLLFAGIGHLTYARTEFQAQVPNWVPMSKDLVVILSGVVEIIMGIAIAFVGRYRVAIGWLAAAFFMAVFPGNIAQYINKIDAFGLDTDRKRLIRLFFQPVLVIWALWSTGALNRRNPRPLN